MSELKLKSIPQPFPHFEGFFWEEFYEEIQYREDEDAIEFAESIIKWNPRLAALALIVFSRRLHEETLADEVNRIYREHDPDEIYPEHGEPTETWGEIALGILDERVVNEENIAFYHQMMNDITDK